MKIVSSQGSNEGVGERSRSESAGEGRAPYGALRALQLGIAVPKLRHLGARTWPSAERVS